MEVSWLLYAPVSVHLDEAAFLYHRVGVWVGAANTGLDSFKKGNFNPFGNRKWLVIAYAFCFYTLLL